MKSVIESWRVTMCRIGVRLLQFPLDQRFNIIPGAIHLAFVRQLDARLLPQRLTVSLDCCVITKKEGR
jgi:hypothetical protein